MLNRLCAVSLVLGTLGLGGTLAACGGEAANEADPGVLDNPSVTTNEDTPVVIAVLPEGSPLSVVRATAPDGQHVDVLGGALRVTPGPDFFGMFTVSFEASDSRLIDIVGVATVIVRPVNDAPIVTPDTTFHVHGDTAIVLAATDVEGDPLSYDINPAPSHGAVSGTPPNVVYRPLPGYDGEDSFTYVVSDGAARSIPATVHLVVGAGSPPTALARTVVLNEDSFINLELSGSDPDGDPLSFAVVTQPVHGTLTGSGHNIFYFPDGDFFGTDQVQFTVSDGVSTSAPATVSITVNSVNDRPVAVAQTVTTAEDTALAITLVGTDVETPAAGLFYSLQRLPAHGTLTGGEGSARVYTPAANYFGPDSFIFTVFDGVAFSMEATVTINVTPVDDPPNAISFAQQVREDTTTQISLLGNDLDDGAVTFAIVTPPAHGHLSDDPPAVRYTPDAEYTGPDSFTYTVTGGSLTTLPATVSITVTPVNDAPVALGATVTTVEDTPVAITLQATDIDSTALTFSIVTPPIDGVLTGSGASWSYTPARDVTGTRSFVFRVSDGQLSATATITIQITPVNDPPIAHDDFAATDPGVAVTFDVVGNDVDPEGDAFTLDSVATPAHGTVAISGGTLVYTPAAGFTGIDVFAYTVSDVHGAASTGQAHVGVGTFPAGADTETIAQVGGSLSIGAGDPPAISSDGRYVAFSTVLPLVSDDTNGQSDIYLFDRGTRTLTRISTAVGGGDANGASQRPALSADGRYIAFDSSASNLVAGDSNVRFDVFRRDRVTGQTLRVSAATGGAQASGDSIRATISEDGNLVAFLSQAFDLVGNDTNGVVDGFVHDVAAGVTERVTVGASGGEGDLAAISQVISGNGQFVAFASNATNLVVGDSNGVTDVFVRDRVAGTTTRISVNSTGGQATAACTEASISRDGRFVSFLSSANTLVAPVTTGVQFYVRDTRMQTTTRSITLANPVIRGRLSGDGRYATLFNASGVVIRDRFAALSFLPPNAASWFWPTLSGNGRYLVVLDRANGNSVTVATNPL